ncbi:sulfite exporter TauE/SafE family protein [Rhodohalobacter sp. 8-1]|uniref:sulfite exporter TauE/SafE family protein n=1 Tax=Rhodohalobacter sp. 8-1 TaxID=3131972 RepID=UPI0030EB5990
MILVAGLIIIGVFTGIVAGIFGIGGGVLFTPILFFVFNSTGIEQPVAWTIGTSLFCTFTAALSSSIQQGKQKNSYLREGVWVGLFGAIGVYFGKLISTSKYYTEELFVAIFACLLLVVSYMFYKRGQSKKRKATNEKPVGVKKSIVTGLGGGFVAAIAGVGGGVVIVPALNLGYKIDISKAVSVSSLAILIISLSGWVQFAIDSNIVAGATKYTVGFVDFGTGLPLIVGAFAGGFLGVKSAEKLPQEKRQIMFSILTVIVSALMIYSII